MEPDCIVKKLGILNFCFQPSKMEVILIFTFLKSTIIFNSSTGDDSWNDNFGIIIFNSRTKENIIFVNCDGSEIVAGTFEVICQLKGFLFNCSHRRILNFLIRIDSRNGTEFIVR